MLVKNTFISYNGTYDTLATNDVPYFCQNLDEILEKLQMRHVDMNCQSPKTLIFLQYA